MARGLILGASVGLLTLAGAGTGSAEAPISAQTMSGLAAPSAPSVSSRLDVSVRSDKGIYRSGERPRIGGRVVVGAGNAATGFVRLRVYEGSADSAVLRYQNIVEVKNGEFTDDGLILQMPQTGVFPWTTKRVSYRVQAIGLTNQLEGDVASAEFQLEEVGVRERSTVILLVFGSVAYVLLVVYLAFMRAPTKRAATVMIGVTYLSALVFMILPLAAPLLIFASADLESLLRTTPIGFLKASVGKSPELQWVINIGGVVAAGAPGAPAGALQGGLAVPLLIMVLATIGAAINMLRRLPEFLRLYDKIPEEGTTAGAAHWGDSGEKLRANLFRYFVYTLSAPFVAMMAYSLMFLADYTNPYALAVVAFSVGFISDTVIEVVMGRARQWIMGKEGRRQEDEMPHPPGGSPREGAPGAPPQLGIEAGPGAEREALGAVPEGRRPDAPAVEVPGRVSAPPVNGPGAGVGIGASGERIGTP